MGKFCPNCGTALTKGAKFCAGCGASTSPVAGGGGRPPVGKAGSIQENILFKAGKKAVAAAQGKAKTYAKTSAKSIMPGAVPAYQAAGELALPTELIPFTGDLTAEGLWPLLKGGLGALVAGFKQTLQDKKRLGVAVALGAMWLLVNFLAAVNLFPLPVRFLSWLTAARGSLIGGSIGKGLVAALLAQAITAEGTLQRLKGGLGQLSALGKGGKDSYAPMLLGAGAGLLACNLMVSSNLQNTMVCVAAFALSAQALTRKGFLRRLAGAILPQLPNPAITGLMRGWTLSFAIFAVLSFLPGGRNGYLLGFLLFISGGVLIALAKKSAKGVEMG